MYSSNWKRKNSLFILILMPDFEGVIVSIESEIDTAHFSTSCAELLHPARYRSRE